MSQRSGFPVLLLLNVLWEKISITASGRFIYQRNWIVKQAIIMENVRKLIEKPNSMSQAVRHREREHFLFWSSHLIGWSIIDQLDLYPIFAPRSFNNVDWWWFMQIIIKTVKDLQTRLWCICLSGAMLSNTLGSSINVKMKTDSFSRR